MAAISAGFFASLLLTLEVCLTWALLAICFSGIGVLWLHRVTGLQPNWGNAYLGVWAGFCLVMATLLVWHFFLPVNSVALWAFLGIAVASLILERRWFLVLLSEIDLSFAFFIGGLALWIGNHGLNQAGMDDYNYEFQSVRWFHDYRIIPGLANLHGRIGFNNSHHLLGAMLSSGPWAGSVNHIFNGFFVVLTLALLTSAVRKVARGLGTTSDLAAALLISPCIDLVLFGIFGPMISTLKADVFTCVATAVLAVLFIEFAHIPPSDSRWAALGTTILLLAAVLYSVKLSAIAFCGVVAGAVLWCLLINAGWRKRSTILAASIAALIVLSVLLRGIVLSGYALYPSTIVGLPVDWRVPVAQAHAEAAYVTSWAQLRPTYKWPVTGWAWLPGWARSTVLTDEYNIVLPLATACLCLPSLFLSFYSRKKTKIKWCWIALAIGCFFALVAWFVQAPAGRFALIYFWILFVSVFAIVADRSTVPAGTAIMLVLVAYLLFAVVGVSREYRSGMVLMLAFSLVWINAALRFVSDTKRKAILCLALGLLHVTERVSVNLVRRQFRELGQMLWLPISTLPERLDKDQYVVRHTKQGPTVYVVVRGTLYETPLPNTRFWNSALELRQKGDITKGFRNPVPANAAQYGYSVRVVVTDSGDKEIVTQDRGTSTSPK